MIAFHNIESFVQMGGYSHYIWPAFFVGFVLLFTHYLFVRIQFRRAKKARGMCKKSIRDDHIT